MITLSPKKMLAELGFAVSRVQSGARSLAAAETHTKGWLVELVGPSGVGKTTLWAQVAPQLKTDWFFEAHAKGLAGQLEEDPGSATYIKRLLAARLEDLAQVDHPLERVALIGQRACEVARLGLVSKTPGLPRGFIMDDGLLHFFAAQVIAQPVADTEAFLKHSACVFLLPDAEQIASATGNAKAQIEIYLALRDLVTAQGQPVLTLDTSTRAENPARMLRFIQNDLFTD